MKAEKHAKTRTKKPVKKKRTNTPALTAKKLRQTKFLKALESNSWHISNACIDSGVPRSTFALWCDTDIAFVGKYETLTETVLDDAEKSLRTNMTNGDNASIIFFLKTKGKMRGYVERETANAKTNKILTKLLGGELTRIEAAYEYAKLGLPLPEVMRLEIARSQVTFDELEATATTPEELDRRYLEAIGQVERQITEFLPPRLAQVIEMKKTVEQDGVFRAEEESQ